MRSAFIVALAVAATMVAGRSVTIPVRKNPLTLADIKSGAPQRHAMRAVGLGAIGRETM